MKKSLILVALLSLVIGCDAIDAMKATKDMKSATNSMNQKMDVTNKGMEKTNKGIEETNEAVRKQKILLAKNDMLEKENTDNLSPVALGMIAGAESFSEAATTEELMKYTKLLLKQINDEKPDDALQNDQGEFSPEVVTEYDHQKMIKFSQILTIAGFTPAEKIEKIINDEIYGGGLYQDEAYAFLMARVFFLGTYLDNDLLARPLKTVKKMEETIKHVASIDLILKAPFKENVKMNVAGFLKIDPIEVSLFTDSQMDDTWNAPKLWKKIMNGFKNDLKTGNIVAGSKIEATAVNKQIEDLKTTVQTYIDSWK